MKLPNLAFTTCILAAIGSSAAGCVGNLADAPAGPAGAPGRTGTGNGGAPGAPGTGDGPSAEPGEVVGSASFTRLTRAEYTATVRAALGVDADLALVPEDGRAGPFTSNASVHPDPVHPYVLAAEDVAAEAIPGAFAACESPSLACVRNVYRAPLERLFRRPISDAEIAEFAALIDGLRAQEVPAVDATRAVIVVALVSPDFLYRSAPSWSDPATHARSLAEHVSYALWDEPPDTTLASAMAGSDPGARLPEEAARLADDSRAVPVLARFLGQWLHVDIDRRLADASFAGSPVYREMLAAVEDALASDTPVTELISGNRGFVHRDNLGAYGLESLPEGSDSDVAAIEWPAESPRRGLLGQELLADATRHPDPSRRVIFRGRLVRSWLLCEPIPVPSAELLAMAGEVEDRTTHPSCMGCHQLLDPIGRAFGGLDLDHVGDVPPAEVLYNEEVGGTYEDLPALLDAIASSRAFAECFARHWLSFFLDQLPDDADDAWIAEIADAVESGASLREVIERTVVTFEASSQDIEPWCEGA